MPASSAAAIIAALKSKRSARNVKGMEKFGISTKGTLGVPVPALRAIAKHNRKNHGLAQALWKSGIHEARLLAGFVDDPAQVTEAQMEKWAKGFDSWDTCDQVCSSLFDKTPYAWKKAKEWAGRKEEFVRRAGFAMMAALAVHDKAAPDSKFLSLLPLIKKHSRDERNFVKKAVNWALRQIGKRNPRLRKAAMRTAKQIQRTDSRAAKWVAADALRELAAEPSKA